MNVLNKVSIRRCNTSELPSSVASNENGKDVARLLACTLSSLGSPRNCYRLSRNCSTSYVETVKMEVRLQGDMFVCVRPGIPNMVLAYLSSLFYTGKCSWPFIAEHRLFKALFGPANAVAYSLLIDDTCELTQLRV